MSIYPTVRPSLTLDFQKSKQLDPRISFSRSSTATYVEGGVVKYADEHQARFEEDGLLVEEARTNKDSNSTVDALNGGINGLTQGSASTIDPTGATSTVETWTVSSDASAELHKGHRFYNNTYVDFTWSLFVKANGINRIQVSASQRDNFGYIDVNLATGELEAQTDPYATLTKLANGWYRISVSRSNRAHGPGFWLLDDSGNRSFQGNGTDGVYVWGIQLEQDSGNLFPTSYIPTAASTVTRSADVAQITGTDFSSWYNQSESTVVTKMTDNGEPNTTFNRDIYYLGTGSSSGNNRIITTTGSGIGAYVQTTGAQVSITGGWYTKGVETVGAFAFKQDNFALATDGVIRGTDNSGDLPTCNRLYLFMNRNEANTLTGHISRFSYYSERLTDTQLEAITS